MKPKILCVDDEPFILEALERMFKGDFEVLTAASPVRGLELLRTNSECAVILSDYQMPDMNGVDFLRAARALAPLSARAILSGQIDLHQISAAINQADIHKFILKPWENNHLRVQMLEAVQIHQTLSERAHFELLSITDPVTELSNHRHFQTRWREELARAANSTEGKAALVIFDVDNFKGFNDRFGHPEGDFLLRTVAMQLKRFASEDGLVARYGGEEFTLILPGRDADDAALMAETIRAAFERTPISGPMSSRAYITLSGGIASFPEHGTDPAELIEIADRALYQAKRQGRNQVAVAAKKSR